MNNIQNFENNSIDTVLFNNKFLYGGYSGELFSNKIELLRLFKLLLLIELNDCLEFWILFKSKIFGYISSK